MERVLGLLETCTSGHHDFLLGGQPERWATSG